MQALLTAVIMQGTLFGGLVIVGIDSRAAWLFALAAFAAIAAINFIIKESA